LRKMDPGRLTLIVIPQGETTLETPKKKRG